MSNNDIFHFGIADDDEYPFNKNQLPPQGFTYDGDSFLNWGEKGEYGQFDNTHHITAIPNSDNYYELIKNWRIYLEGYLKGSQRLIDYVIITDREDWSENARVWLIDGSIS